MTSQPDIRPTFPLLRYFVISSLVIILVATTVVGFLFVQFGESAFRTGIERRSAEEAVHFSAIFFDGVWDPSTSESASPSWEEVDQTLFDEFARSVTFGLSIVQITVRDVDDRLIFTTAAFGGLVPVTPQDAVDRVVRQGLPYAAVYQDQELATPDGIHELDVVITYAPLRDISPEAALEGQIVGIMAIAQDITEEFEEARRSRILTAIIGSALMGAFLFLSLFLIVYQGDRRLERQRQELEVVSLQAARSGRLAAIGELVSGVVHELNNPLSGVAGISRIMMERDLDNTTREELSIIRRETDRSIRIVQNLLDFARPSSGSGMVQLSMNEVVRTALDLRRNELQMGNITLVEDLDPDIPTVLGDAHELQQVVLNLTINAEQAMTKAHGGGRLFVRSESTGDMVRVIISDNGPGISSESIDRLFDPFFTTKDPGEGTGLGLSISYGIIRNHSGKLWAESDPPHGATFFVELPSYQPE